MNNLIEQMDWSRIRLLAFDAVGTLIKPRQSIAATYAQVAEGHGVIRDAIVIAERFSAAFQSRSPENGFDSLSWRTSEAAERAAWRELVCQVLDVEGAKAELIFEELWNYYAQPANWILFDDAQDCLAGLADPSIDFIIASNFDVRLHVICQSDPLLASAKRVFPSSEVLWRKPSIHFYRTIEEQMGLLPEQILMVGDDFRFDYAAAKHAGWQALPLDRKADRSGSSLRSLTELSGLLLGNAQ